MTDSHFNGTNEKPNESIYCIIKGKKQIIEL